MVLCRHGIAGALAVLLGCGGRVEGAAEKPYVPGGGVTSAETTLSAEEASVCTRSLLVPEGDVLLENWALDAASGTFVPKCDTDNPLGDWNAKVHVPAFWLDEVPTSTGCFSGCASAKLCRSVPSGPTELPAIVTMQDAASFCAAKGGRLPSIPELVRAAQSDHIGPGVRGFTDAALACTLHPATMDAALCASLEAMDFGGGSLEFPRNPPIRPVGSTPIDIGPFGHRDLDGLIFEWTRSHGLDGGERCSLQQAQSESTYFSNEGSGWLVQLATGILGALHQERPQAQVVRYLFPRPSTPQYNTGFRCAYAEKPEPGPLDAGTDVDTDAFIAVPSPTCRQMTLRVPAGLATASAWSFSKQEGRFVDASCQEERPPHDTMKRLMVSEFWLDVYPVTNACYAGCNAGGCTDSVRGTGGIPVSATHDEAEAFCQARGGRLPTYAEMLRAAQADQQVPGVAAMTQAAIDCFASIPEVPTEIPSCAFEFEAMNYGAHGLSTSRLREVGTVPLDVGPFGHHDLWGSAYQWTNTYVRTLMGGPFCSLPPTGPDFVTFDNVIPPQFEAVQFASQLVDIMQGWPGWIDIIEVVPATTRAYNLSFRCAFDSDPSPDAAPAAQ